MRLTKLRLLSARYSSSDVLKKTPSIRKSKSTAASDEPKTILK